MIIEPAEKTRRLLRDALAMILDDCILSAGERQAFEAEYDDALMELAEFERKATVNDWWRDTWCRAESQKPMIPDPPPNKLADEDEYMPNLDLSEDR